MSFNMRLQLNPENYPDLSKDDTFRLGKNKHCSTFVERAKD